MTTPSGDVNKAEKGGLNSSTHKSTVEVSGLTFELSKKDHMFPSSVITIGDMLTPKKVIKITAFKSFTTDAMLS